jgi:hypothetical protein
MAASGTKKQRTKFEEDIKAPFVSLYSFSTTVAVGDWARFETLGDVARLFPDLVRQLGKRSLDAPIEAVRGFTAREVVLGGASMTLARKPKTRAESGLIVWYDEAGRRDRPCAVEFSFRYGKQEGGVRRANQPRGL